VAKQDIVVIGGSAGSGPPLKRLLGALPTTVRASFFVATHVPAGSEYLAQALASVSTLPVIVPEDRQPIEQGCVYVAVPDHHLLLLDRTLRLGNGPRENMTRPAIDPLFRSAALSFGPRVVGVILSGMLNDGASGLWAIKACGGTAIVQHPLDAAADQMPLAALEAADVDEVVASEDLARVLVDTIERDAGPIRSCPDSLALEVSIAAGARLGAETLHEFADPSALSCPDCHGVLSEVRRQQPLRYRCQIGHASTADVLEARKTEIDDALRVALRVMEERVTLVTRMAADARENSRIAVAELYESRAAEFRRYAEVLRQAATESMKNGSRIRDEDR
jgi:two-component system chemotaxis response regulator CheB